MCKIITYYLRLALTNTSFIIIANSMQRLSAEFFFSFFHKNVQQSDVRRGKWNVLEIFFIYGLYEVGFFAVRVAYKSYKFFIILEEQDYISQIAQTSKIK